MLDSWAGKSGAVVTCICAGIIGTLLLMVWIVSASAAPQAPGVELGPDHTQQGNPGQIVRYNHTLTNTGTTTDIFLVEATSTQRWPVELIAGIHPTEALTLSLHVGTQMTASFQVSLTVPRQVCGVTEVTVVTATSQLSPTVQDTAIDQTIVPCKTYLPLVMKRWPPIPYQPTLNPINNPDSDGNYYVTWTEQPSRLADTYTLQEATDAAFTIGLRNACTTAQQSCLVSGRLAGIYYYRVRGHNSWGCGAFSNVEAVTVLPPPTPIPAVVVLSSNAFVPYRGSLCIVGEVSNNTSSNVDFVRINATLRTPSGDVVDSDYSYSMIDKLAPSMTSPFLVQFWKPPKWAFYELVVTWNTASRGPYPLEVLNSTSYFDSYNEYHVVGEIKNQYSESRTFVKAFVTLYDANGEVIGADYSYTNPDDLAPGQTASFDTGIYFWKYKPDKSKVARHLLQVYDD